MSETTSLLARDLGPVDATALVVGGIIGSGIFVAPGIVAREAGAPGLSLAVWGVGGLLALSGALCYAELGAAIPESGGTYPFLRRAYHSPLPAFLYAWSFVFVSAPGAIAALAIACASYAGFFFDAGAANSWIVHALAAGAIAILTALNYIGVRRGGRTQTVLTVLKLGALSAVVVVGLALGHGGGAHFVPFFPAGGASLRTWSGAGTALIPVLFAYSGWPIASYVGGEIRNPQRNVPVATLSGVAIVICVYLLVNATYLYVMPFSAFSSSTLVASDAMQRVIGPHGGALVAGAVVLSTLGALNASILGYPRIGFALARDGLFLPVIGRVHPRFRTPTAALLLQGALAIGFTLMGGYERILEYFAFVDYFFFVCAVAAIIVLRVREPGLRRPYRALGYPITPLIFLAISVVYLANSLVHRFGASMVGIGLTLFGLPFYWTWRHRAGQGSRS